MNILYTNFHDGPGGGHTTYILSLLRNSEHQKYVACPPTSRLYRILQAQGYDKLIPMIFAVPLHELRKLSANTLAFKRVIEKHDIDIVHTNGSPDNRMALYASMLSRKKFKTVYTKHNTLKVKGVISRWRHNNFNAGVIFVAQAAITLAGLQPGNPKYHVVTNGVDVEHWRRTTPVRSGRELRLISNGGTPLHKGWMNLVEAIATLGPEERKRLSVVLLGREDPGQKEIRARARALCNISFPGLLDDARPLLEEADIGFLLSKREASPFSSREMSAMSLPMITSDFPSHVDLVDAKTGWVTAYDNVESIRQVLEEILTMSPEALDRMKLAARAKAENEFSLEKMIAETNAVYAAVMSGVK